jgi:geranylgeranyl reductase
LLQAHGALGNCRFGQFNTKVMTMSANETFDVVVVGGGPAGATAANELARKGHSVLLLDRAGRIKPCGGAIPPRLIKDFAIPDSLLVAKAQSARMVSPTSRHVDIPIENGFVGMVNRDAFDEWLRTRAAEGGAERRMGSFVKIDRDADGISVVHYLAREKHMRGEAVPRSVRARSIIGADGARSEVAKQGGVPGADKGRYVFAYHEIVRAPAVKPAGYDGTRCDVFYEGTLSPDFYGWVFPHGNHTSVGCGSGLKGHDLRGATADLRRSAGLVACPAGARRMKRSVRTRLVPSVLGRTNGGRTTIATSRSPSQSDR